MCRIGTKFRKIFYNLKEEQENEKNKIIQDDQFPACAVYAVFFDCMLYIKAVADKRCGKGGDDGGGYDGC